MTLKQLLEKEDLLKYIEGYCEDNLNRMTFKSYEKIKNGYILHTKVKDYKIMVKLYEDEYTYYGEKKRNDMFDFFERIPCMTQAEERKYPKVVGWLGTALADKMNSTLSKSC